MGYDVFFRESRFFMAAEDKPKALEAILADPELQEILKPHLTMTRAIEQQAPCRLEDALQWIGNWSVDADDQGNLINLVFDGDQAREAMSLVLECIAPWVKPGSYVVLEGEDGLIWRWYFNGKTIIEQYARLVFDDPPADGEQPPEDETAVEAGEEAAGA